MHATAGLCSKSPITFPIWLPCLDGSHFKGLVACT
uniref:Uncharacterized protein n=1 Tax=Arundo donax TaxID=35708 RepID=A0A0A8ZEA5_ARUDO